MPTGDSLVPAGDSLVPTVESRVPKSEQLASLLIDVEAGLRQLELWEHQAPSAEALASTQPFCIDTLNFAQWLQHIFLPTLYHLLAERLPLPTECGIAPMAQEYFSGQALLSSDLEGSLAAVDRLLTADREPPSQR